ncbi:hypothetical protein GCM10007158_00060 [Vreelandella hamiltonii]|uniref:Uncharacterized protein n=2 Tax=Halomonadaceae TaxID=28256 RepID=A0A8H9I326_9GAMM|nr:hypothetical protein GCM10007157_15410 [Halomonas hamiltonii]GGW43632.1 hypothetical protein GCM10007158_00060 [Halomonas johnsoniae]
MSVLYEHNEGLGFTFTLGLSSLEVNKVYIGPKYSLAHCKSNLEIVNSRRSVVMLLYQKAEKA